MRAQLRPECACAGGPDGYSRLQAVALAISSGVMLPSSAIREGPLRLRGGRQFPASAPATCCVSTGNVRLDLVGWCSPVPLVVLDRSALLLPMRCGFSGMLACGGRLISRVVGDGRARC